MKDAAKPKKTRIVYAAALVTAAIAAFILWAASEPPALEREKAITVTVNHTDGTVTTLPVETLARYLYDALEPYELLAFAGSDYGTIITTVDGEYADIDDYITWKYAVNGAEPEHPMNELPIADGDTVTFYTITW